MSIADFAALGSLASSLALLLSLVYLNLQVRQNTHAHRVTAHQERLNFVKEFLGRLTDGAVAPVYLRGLSADAGMTEVEFTQFRALMHSWFLGMAEIFWLHDQGVLDDDRFAGSMAALKGYLGYPGCRAVWQAIRDVMPADFQALVDKLVADGAVTSPHRAYDVWRAAIAAQAPVGGAV